MNQRIKRILSNGAILLLVAITGVCIWLFWPKQNFTLPNGHRITVEAVTWRPDNRIATTSMAGTMTLLNRFCVRMKLPQIFNNPYQEFGPYFPGMIFLSGEDSLELRQIEIRLQAGPVEGPPIQNISALPNLGSGRFVLAFPMETVPRDGGTLVAKVYWKGTRTEPRRQIGAFALNPSVAPRPSFSTNAFWTPDPMTNGLSVSVVDFQVSATIPPTNVLDTALLRLKILENGVSNLSTNWEVASVVMLNESGDAMLQHVDNRGFSNGVLRAGLRPPWLDGGTWRLTVNLARNRDFPETNKIRLGHLVPGFGLTTNVDGRIFTARIDLGGQTDPVPMATNWQASLAVRVSSGAELPHHVRWVGLTDQRGTNYDCPYYAWGDGLFRFSLGQPTNFLEGTVKSAEAVVSWEPIVPVEVLAKPVAATNFSDWPKRRPVTPQLTNAPAG